MSDLDNIRLLKTLQRHTFKVHSVTFSPDGKLLASGSYDKTVKVWDVRDLNKKPKTLRGHENWVKAVAFQPELEEPYFYLEDPEVQEKKIRLMEKLKLMEESSE